MLGGLEVSVPASEGGSALTGAAKDCFGSDGTVGLREEVPIGFMIVLCADR